VLRALRPGQGTALGDALTLAIRIGRKERSSDGTIPPESVLVFSDGAAQGGVTPVAAAVARARNAHVPVSAVVLGTPAGYVQAKLPTGQSVTIQVPPSPSTLHRVATETGGQFATEPTDTRLRAVYEQLSSHLGTRKARRELGDAFAAGGLVLLLLGGGASALWFRRVP
jgi:Ca-activated chloride channel homolog